MYQPRSPYRGGYGAPYATGTAVSTPGLLGQVLGITGVGFVITACAAYLFRGVSPVAGLMAFIAALVVLFVMSAVRRNPQVALLWFYAFTFLEGIGLAPTIARYVAAIGPGVVVEAAATTGFGMLVLGGVAFVFSVDWRRFQGIAFGALIALLVVGLISAFTHFIHPSTYSWLVLGVFTLITLVDFSRIRAGGDGNSPVELAVSIYLDAINIFIALLQLFGARSRDD
ncbi:MAG TPA: Bax inhibitor-1 family protein [Dongiaceae bacterium]|nr:Bax inhibitor-1 family protein [Dongiaceae bacterium]